MPNLRRHLIITLSLVTLARVIVLSRLSLVDHFPARSASSTTNAIEGSNSKKEKLVVLVQGNAENFPTWYERIETVSRNFSGGGIALVYASYDAPVNETCCRRGGEQLPEIDHNIQTLYIPNSTWTEGRNALAQAAFCWEKQRSRLFSYWIVFADDDMELGCRYDSQISEVECWGRFFGFVEDQAPLSHAATIALANEGRYINQTDGVVLTNSYDAILNAYNREFVPRLLPYVTKMSTTTSWWLSQAVHFSLMRSCCPMAGLVPLQFYYRNPSHRDYPRGGLSVENVAQLLADNYDPYTGNAIKKPINQSDLDQFAETLWFDTAMTRLA